MKTIEEVLANYFTYKPIVNQEREKLIRAYYANEHKLDPCFKKIENHEYHVSGLCDIFFNTHKTGNVLAIYSSDLEIIPENIGKKANYPLQVFADNTYCYYGIKLNALAYLSSVHIDQLILFYSNGKSMQFRKKIITAQVMLDHYLNHFHEKPIPISSDLNKLTGSTMKLFND